MYEKNEEILNSVEANLSLVGLAEKEIRKPFLYEAIISFLILILVMGIGIIKYEVDPHMPMLIGVIGAALIATKIGYKWPVIRQFMYDGIGQALQAVIILMLIGILVGVWVIAGVVPSMIYYGLLILSPSFFLIACVLICSIASLATGTSWGTMGTIGIALIGISIGLNIPVEITAGAIISGAYFGDKLSPLSDTTNLAPVVSNTDLFTHIKFMIIPTLITYVITLCIFAYLNTKYSVNNIDLKAIENLKTTLLANFQISPILLLPPIAVILAIALKIYAMPGIMIGIITGCILAPIYQNVNFGELLNVGMNGFSINSGNIAIDKLLNTGGLMNMMPSVSLTILAMMFGGIVEKTGQLEVIVNYLLKFVKSARGLLVGTMGTCILSNMTMPEQYISIVVPGKMFVRAYEKMQIEAKTLSNALESSGTVTSALVPWNTCGIYISTVLGVGTFAYWPYAIFNFLMPIMVIILSYFGLSIVYKKTKS